MPPFKLLSAAASVLAMVIASANADANDDYADLREWTIQELPFPAMEDLYNDLGLFVNADGTRYVFAEWYHGMLFGDDEWEIVNFSGALDDLDLRLDYIRYAVDSTGGIHFVALTYLDEVLYGTNADGEWKTEAVDSIPIIDGGWSWTPRPSIIIDDQGSAHLCYHNMDDPHDLRYATNARGNWTVWSIDQALYSSSHYAMDLAADGSPRVAYWNYNTSQLMFVKLDGDDWTVGPITSDDAGSRLLSVILDVSEDDRSHVAYCLYESPPHEFYVWNGLYCAAENDHGWEATLLDGKWSNDFAYLDVSGQLDGEGNFHLCYHDVIDRDLVYACNKEGAFERQIVDAVDRVGRRGELALDSDYNVHVVYLNETSETVKYALGEATATPSTADGDDDMFLMVAAVTLVIACIAAFAIIAWRPMKP